MDLDIQYGHARIQRATEQLLDLVGDFRDESPEGQPNVIPDVSAVNGGQALVDAYTSQLLIDKTQPHGSILVDLLQFPQLNADLLLLLFQLFLGPIALGDIHDLLSEGIHLVAELVLPPSRSDRRSQCTDQHRHPDGAFQDRDVPKQFHRPVGNRRGCLRIREQENGEVGPRWLPPKYLDQAARLVTVKHFL